MRFLNRLHFLKNFYVATSLGLVVWLFVFAQNDIPSQIINWNRLRLLDNEKANYLMQMRQLKRQTDQTVGSDKLTEKYGREQYYMRKPTEDVYVLVNEKGEEVEK